MYAVIQSLTEDGRERSLDYKISGFLVPRGCWDAQVCLPSLRRAIVHFWWKVLDYIEPAGDEIVLSKGSCSVFQSTNLDYLLRCMEKKDLIVCGSLTDQCVSHAVRDACDLGYRVTVIAGLVAALSLPLLTRLHRLLLGYE